MARLPAPAPEVVGAQSNSRVYDPNVREGLQGISRTGTIFEINWKLLSKVRVWEI